MGVLENAGLCSKPAKGTRSSRKLAKCSAQGEEQSSEALRRGPTLWLPNVLVDGIRDGRPALAKLREARNADALRLLLHIYAACDLSAHNGVPVEKLRFAWPLNPLGDRADCSIFGVAHGTFQSGGDFAAPFLTGRVVKVDGRTQDEGWERLFSALRLLRSLKLITFSGYIFDGASGVGQALFPFLCDDSGAEEAFADRVRQAGSSMLTRPLRGGKQKIDAFKGFAVLVPVQRHIKPHAIGICRPRYLPDTEATRRWLAKIERWRTSIEFLPVA